MSFSIFLLFRAFLSLYLNIDLYFSHMFILGSKYIVSFCFLIQTDNLCLLSRVVRPLIFNLIIDIFGFNSNVLLFSICLIHSLFPFPLLLYIFMILLYLL